MQIHAEPDNPQDPNALLVVLPAPATSTAAAAAATAVPVGHLSAAVAAHLGPLVCRGAVTVQGVVREAPPGDKAAVSIELRVEATGSGGFKE